MADREPNETEIEKIKAETAKIQAEIKIEQARAELEAAKLKAEAEKILAEKRVQDEALVQAGYATRHMERTEQELLAGDAFNQVYYFNSSVGDQSARACMQRLAYWSRIKPGCDIEIVFNSPGGSVIDGLALFDFIQGLKRKGHKVTTRALGMAASMAGILLQVGSERVMAKEAWVLIHEVSTLAIGKIGEIEDEVKFVKMIQERVLRIFADGCAKAHKENPTVCTKPFTVSSLRKGWNRKDWWLSSDECLEHGLVDRVD